MYKTGNYTDTDRMCDLITENYPMLLVLSRFGIALGFGDKNIREVCRGNGVDTATFLAVVNILAGSKDDYNIKKTISVESLIRYLQHSHSYFLDYRLPAIRAKLIQAIKSVDKNVSAVIIRFFDEYTADVSRHMRDEEKTLFPNLKKMLAGEGYNASVFSRQHNHLEKNIAELKNIIIKYCNTPSSNDLNSVLFDIFLFEQDLASHILVEDRLILSLTRKTAPPHPAPKPKHAHEQLTQREKEVVVCVVKGMTNKQIADELFLSPHTVLTHRKNIAAKLQIHSPAGLTIYAIVNKLVELEEIKAV
ncbi:MAG: helix-turn-helix transcriptional regulator [Prevotellaceae bacterium]|jgi:regulator of cell morphogenesis and NO signaling|nr:helix-turn-helix transcriptional regulator [Prevotellaceae bacterium]